MEKNIKEENYKEKLPKIIKAPYYYKLFKKRIKYFSTLLLNHSQKETIFNKLFYDMKKISLLYETERAVFEESIMTIINNYIEEDNQKNNFDNNQNINFISIILGKLFLEKIIREEMILRLSKFLLEKKKYEAFFELLSFTKNGNIFNIIKRKKINNDENEKIKVRDILNKNIKYLKAIFSLS